MRLAAGAGDLQPGQFISVSSATHGASSDSTAVPSFSLLKAHRRRNMVSEGEGEAGSKSNWVQHLLSSLLTRISVLDTSGAHSDL